MPRAPVLARDDEPPSKAAMLDAALRLFVRHGVDAVTVRAIAGEAGYTNPALFKFWAGKDALALDVFARAYDLVAGRLAAALADDAPFERRLRGLVTTTVELIDDQPELFLFVHEQLRTYWPKLPLAPRRRSILRMLERLLDAGVAEGRVSVDHDHRLLVAAMVGVLGQLARAAYFEELPRPTKPLAGELERLLQRVLW